MLANKKQPLVIETQEEAQKREQIAREALANQSASTEAKPAKKSQDASAETHRSILRVIKHNAVLSVIASVLIFSVISLGVWFVWDKIRLHNLAQREQQAKETSQKIANQAVSGELTKDERFECDQAKEASEALWHDCLTKKRMEKIDKALTEQADKLLDPEKENLLVIKITELVAANSSEAELDKVAVEIEKIEVSSHSTYRRLSEAYIPLNLNKALDYMKKARAVYKHDPEEPQFDDNRTEDQILDGYIKSIEKMIAEANAED